MRERLRHNAPQYEEVRDNFVSGNHAMRTLVSGAMISTIAPMSVLDPACGDASIIEVAHRMRPIDYAVLSDISRPQIEAIAPTFKHTAEVADVMEVLARPGKYDMVVLTEILEHIEDPDLALRLARLRGDFLLVSSPIGDPEAGRNKEHLWAWDLNGYEEMLRAEGWDPRAKVTQMFHGQPWTDQIWLAR